MDKEFSQLIEILDDQRICKDTNYEAYYHLEQVLLLALKDSGTLSAVQYHLAEQALKHQRAERARKIRKEED